jgi:hypothetical protein
MRIITFDFDGTIEDTFGKLEVNPFKEKIQELIRTLIKEGFFVHIVTRRFGPENSHKGSKNEHIEVYEMATKLGVDHSNVHFTNREWKYLKLDNLGSHFHIDDDEQDIFNIKFYGKGTKGFLLCSEDGPEKFYNLLKK